MRDFLVRARESGAGAARLPGDRAGRRPAYEVFARVLRARFGIVEGMDAEAAKAQVRAQVAAVLEDRKVGDVAYFLGQLLDLEFQDSPLIKAVEGDAAAAALDAPRGHQALPRGRRRARAPSRLSWSFDDLQWAHDDSLDLLAYLVESLAAPILVICIARPEMLARRDGWKQHGGRPPRARRALAAQRHDARR